MTTTPFPYTIDALANPLTEISRIDQILDLNREALLDAAKLPKEDREEKVAKVKGRINVALDERWEYMKLRDAKR